MEISLSPRHLNLKSRESNDSEHRFVYMRIADYSKIKYEVKRKKVISDKPENE